MVWATDSVSTKPSYVGLGKDWVLEKGGSSSFRFHLCGVSGGLGCPFLGPMSWEEREKRPPKTAHTLEIGGFSLIHS